MCGRCRNVFNAFESLKRIEDGGAGDTVDYSIVDPRHVDSVLATGDTEHRGNGGPPSAHESAGPAELHGASSSAEGQIDPTHADVETLHDAVDAPESTHDRASNSTNDSASGNNVDGVTFSDAAETDAAAGDELDEQVDGIGSNNPLIVGPMPTVQRAQSAGGWRWLGGISSIVLVLQILYAFRSEIAQQYPALRPSFVTACEIAGCAVAFGRDANAIKIESSDLIEPPGKPGRILLTATIANRANTPHDFPFLEVKLMDANNAVLSSRVLNPGEYLGRRPARDENIAANTELYVNLNLELAGKTPASGYGLRAFYP